MAKATTPNQLQVIKTIEKFEEQNDVANLMQYMQRISPDMLLSIYRHESVLRARALVHFHRSEYQEMYSILESHQFAPASHQRLQQLWQEARYREAQIMRGR